VLAAWFRVKEVTLGHEAMRWMQVPIRDLPDNTVKVLWTLSRTKASLLLSCCCFRALLTSRIDEVLPPGMWKINFKISMGRWEKGFALSPMEIIDDSASSSKLL
jgi:hypothetical protein